MQMCKSKQTKVGNKYSAMDCFCYMFRIYSSVHYSYPFFSLLHAPSLFTPSMLFPPSLLLPRSCCTSCPSSPLKMISTSCSNISGALRVWRTRKERTPRPLSGFAHAVSGSFELDCADVWIVVCFCNTELHWET